MNLHQVVRGAIGSINPDVIGTWLKSTGSTTGADGTQTPTYAAPQTVPMQVQFLTGKDIRQLDGLGIQGVQRTVFMQGNVQAVNRPGSQGGDLITFDSTAPADLASTTWLCVAVLETWSPGWCKVGITRQVP